MDIEKYFVEVLEDAFRVRGQEVEIKNIQPNDVDNIKQKFETKISNEGLRCEIRKDPFNRLYVRTI